MKQLLEDLPVSWFENYTVAFREYRDSWPGVLERTPKPGDILRVNGIDKPHMTVDTIDIEPVWSRLFRRFVRANVRVKYTRG